MIIGLEWRPLSDSYLTGGSVPDFHKVGRIRQVIYQGVEIEYELQEVWFAEDYKTTRGPAERCHVRWFPHKIRVYENGIQVLPKKRKKKKK